VASAPDRCVPPERRRIGMVFQDHALWPHLSVLDTVAYPLRRAGASKAAARQGAQAILAQLNLGPLADRRPGQLSGGEQQRVGLARALACQPAVYLFDEPTAHLDAGLRGQILREVARRRASAGAAAIYATHDATEALAIADRVAVLHSGRLAQLAAPAAIYAEPDDLTVARLTGPVSVLHAPVSAAEPGTGQVTPDAGRATPGTGQVTPDAGRATPGTGRVTPDAGRATPGTGQVTPEAGRATIGVGEVRVTVPCGSAPGAGPLHPAAPAVLVRPDWARLGAPVGLDDTDGLPGAVTEIRFRGPYTDYHLDTPAGPLLIREAGPPRAGCGPVRWSLLRARLMPREHLG
jgi:ABC-type polar amino acid transport system ATPase subunit